MKKKIITNTYLREAEQYTIKLFLNEDDYYISVKKLIHLSEKFIIRDNIVAMDDGYYIMEIIPKKGNYALRLFIDNNKKIVEYYFDIIKESGIDKEYKVPYFIDLYLDITVLYTGKVDILDEDELLEAYDKKDITKKEYEMVLKIKEKLLKEIKSNSNQLMKIDYLKYLKGM